MHSMTGFGRGVAELDGSYAGWVARQTVAA